MNLSVFASVGRSMFVGTKIVAGTIQRHAPEILMTAGIVGGVVTTVGACKATLKVNEVFEEANVNYEKIEYATEVGEVNGEPYTLDDAKTDKKTVHGILIGSVIKNYGPVALIGAASITSILCGYNILNRRNMAIVAAYTTLDAGFKTYRKRVIAELGEDADERFRTGKVSKKIETEVLNEETGELKNKKVKAEVVEEGVEPIDYSINFCREAIHIRDRNDLSASRAFIQNMENSMNLTLKAQKYVTLNEVREALGIPKVSYGQIVGWTLDGSGDDCIELKQSIVYDEELESNTIIIDPNVEGIMFNKIDVVREIPNV
jgi:hypothetical protein